MMRKYSWYTAIVQKELRKKVNQYMEENGGIPDGDLSAIVKITLDERGNVLKFDISDSSGNPTMDAAVLASLKKVKISEPPPSQMPKTLRLKISAKG
jgi:TonB family protein